MNLFMMKFTYIDLYYIDLCMVIFGLIEIGG